MDGLTAVRHVREEEKAGSLANNLVIALSASFHQSLDYSWPTAGNARQGQIDEAKAAGMDDVIIKPYRLDDLLQKIENMMRIRASRNTSAVETVETPDAMEIEMGE
jgi:CheY-like chemotaxis protein